MTEPGGRTRLSSGPRGHGQVCGVGRRQGGVGSRARLCLGGRGAGRRPGAGLGQGRWDERWWPLLCSQSMAHLLINVPSSSCEPRSRADLQSVLEGSSSGLPAFTTCLALGGTTLVLTVPIPPSPSTCVVVIKALRNQHVGSGRGRRPQDGYNPPATLAVVSPRHLGCGLFAPPWLWSLRI